MLAASMCRDIHFSVLPPNLSSTVPRCLFGSPNAKDTVDLLQEALDMERSKFARRWGVDPRNEDKENFTNFKNKSERVDKSPRKRAAPYSRQSSIHEFWRSRKAASDTMCKKTSSVEAIKQSNCNADKPASSSS